MSDSELIPSHRTPMSDICDNLVSARALTACYFELDTRMAASPEDLLCVLNKAYIYLDAHMGILHDFKLVDSCYGLSLCTLICVLVGQILFEQHPLAWRRWFLTELEMDHNNYKLDETFSLPGEEGYEVNGDHSPRPTMIKTLEPPKDPIFPPISTRKVEGHRSPSGSPLPVPIASKHKHMQGSAMQLPADDPEIKRSTRSMKPPMPFSSLKLSKPPASRCGTRTSARKAKVAPVHEPPAMLAKNWMLAYSSGNVVLSDSGDEDSTLQDLACNDSGQETEEVMARPIKQVRLVSPAAISPPPVHVYHPLTGEPLTALTYISLSALSEPVQPFPVAGTSSKGKSKEKARVAALPAPAVAAPIPSMVVTASDVMDSTIYTCGFHPDIDLQFHEPPSREALERMKMFLLPAAPVSLTKPPSQIHSGWEYVYRCHSDPNPYFI
ncbi:hypothetical protein IW261DRAFT_1423536 [Armillaria novae-zelandiae]|uniref:Uncharacterized protein n=1 Tax=Armillaria novae-zelandiae TaxID=153914 RepID=A0AA39U8W0_9AGAR|nr:hypothetical protein IW261DRAFT_1423536 [Armillaria novae-zelandiae]